MRRSLGLCLLLLSAVLAASLHQSLFFGKGLVPAEGALHFPPWNAPGRLSGVNYLLADQYLDLGPMRQFFWDNLRRGRFPLWNPFLACGVPFLASMQAAVLFPVNLLLSPLEPFRAAGIAAFLKLLLAGTFTALYLRRLGAGPAGVLLSAVAFSLSGFMVVWLGHPQANAACLLPALAYLLDRGLSEKGLKPWAAFSLAYAAMLLGGHAPTSVHISLWLCAYLLAVPSSPDLRRTGLFLLSVCVGAFIAAPQLLPFLEYWRESSSSESAGSLGRWATHLSPGTLTHWLLPRVSGSPVEGFERLGLLLGLGGSDNFNERTGFVGVFTLLSAGAAALLRFRGDRRVRFHAISAVLCLLAVYGTPPLPLLFRHIPALNGINPTRLLLLAGFSLATLGGLGPQALGLLKPDGRRAWVAAVAVFAALTSFWLWEVFAPYWAGLAAAERSFVLEQVPFFFGACLAAAAAAFPGKAWRKAAGPLCVACVVVELLWFGKGLNPAIARSLYYPETPFLRRLRADSSVFRVIGLERALPPDTGMVYGLQDARGQDFMSLKRYEELITGTSGDFSFYAEAARIPAAWRLLNAKYFLTSPRSSWKPPPGFERAYQGELRAFRPDFFMKRASLVYDYRVMRPREALDLARSQGFDPRRLLLLEEEPPPAESGQAENAPSARIVEYDPDEVVVEASSPRPAFLLLLDAYYPGWTAFVNGRPARILRADYAFRAVRLPAGKSTARFTYAPWSFRLGLALSGAGLALVLAALFCSK